MNNCPEDYYPLSDERASRLVEVHDIELGASQSVVLSIRLNREELRVLTTAARFYDTKLSTYIKHQALREAELPQVRMLGD